ncbi:nucleoside deaminase [Oceanitalea stevensii]|uniref:Nucleoside deaminase n=1 Tax=Oceanitalea stevensii TaxID=2763072 RepID=A0ABR8Z6J5_9MICO|nr:nucleoside deaminase [Oceanitalea stevensii]MBD8063797.1 nucleoside deaminase [Oceanitalea stevensii]
MDEETVTTELTAVVARAERNVVHDGGPFAAVVVLPDGRRFEGVNQVVPTSDPTAHAEVVAIRRACAATGSVALEGAVVYASCEPCPMCVAAALWARVDAVYYAADRHDAARAGFDDAAFHDYFTDPGRRELLPVVRQPVPAATRPFLAWQDKADRTPY